MTRPKSSRPLLVGVGVVVVLIATALGYWGGFTVAARSYQKLLSDLAPIQEQNAAYPLVAPLLAYRVPEAVELGEYQSLKTAIQSDIDAVTGKGVSRVSVYFRDLDTSRWLGVNQDADYYPASLLKVPVMIAYYKEAEADPAVLDQVITYQNISTGDPFDAPSNLLPGVNYTVEQLIEAMIISSDNGATLTLLNHIDPDTLSEVYANLGIQNPGNDSADYQISTRTYALFFRILYNATYLSPEYSNKALALLSRATFAQGLVAGLPAGTDVAHKFGEHVLNNGTIATGVELHDCGIVYYPSHPYLLCVMTSAKDVPTASTIIENISATTFAAIATEYGSSTPLK